LREQLDERRHLRRDVGRQRAAGQHAKRCRHHDARTDKRPDNFRPSVNTIVADERTVLDRVEACIHSIPDRRARVGMYGDG